MNWLKRFLKSLSCAGTYGDQTLPPVRVEKSSSLEVASAQGPTDRPIAKSDVLYMVTRIHTLFSRAIRENNMALVRVAHMELTALLHRLKGAKK